MSHFNWYVDTVADFYKTIPPKWNLKPKYPERAHFIEDGNWGLISPWDLNQIGDLQNGQHKWVSYDCPIDNGHPIIPILFHMHWDPNVIDLLIHYLSDPIRANVLKSDNAQLLIHYAVEGFAHEVFQGLAKLQSILNINPKKILFCCGSLNVASLYDKWATQRGLSENNKIRVCYDVPWLRHVLHSPQFAALKDKKLPISISQWEIYKRARYVCLNRRLHPHRLLSVTEIVRRDLLQYGRVSLPKDITEEYDQLNTKTFTSQWKLWEGLFKIHPEWNEIEQTASYINNNLLPLSADDADLNVNLCHDINPELSDIPLSVITETHFFKDLAFPSEKIWKPMAYGQVFLPIAAAGFDKGLNELGFKTFDTQFSKLTGLEFDSEANDLMRMDTVINILEHVCKLTDEEFISFLSECEENVIINRSMIFDYRKSRELSSKSLKKEIEKHAA